MTVPVFDILVDCQVQGHPKTKGSLEHIGQGKMRESVTGSKQWRKMVAERVKNDAEKRGYSTEFHSYAARVGVRVVSYLQPPPAILRRPASAWRHWLMSDKSGDADKLLRNVLDAIGCENADDAQLIDNDGQVWDAFSHKRLAVEGVAPGQLIQVWKIPEETPW